MSIFSNDLGVISPFDRYPPRPPDATGKFFIDLMPVLLCFQVDRITEQVVSFIHSYDLQGLRDFWNHLDKRLFVKLNPSLNPRMHSHYTTIMKYS